MFIGQMPAMMFPYVKLLKFIFLMTTSLYGLTQGCTAPINADIHAMITIHRPDGSVLLQLTDSSMNVGRLEGVNDLGAVTVHGHALWLIFAGRDYGEPRVLVNAEQSKIVNISMVVSDSVSSIQKVGLRCEDRPVGVQSRNIIPDSAFTDHLRYGGGLVIEARFRSCCWFSTSVGGWVQVDLGAPHRLYAVSNHGSRYGSASYYYTSEFHLIYGVETAVMNEYHENGALKVFEGNTAATWNEEIRRHFADPFIARYVRFVVGGGRYMPIMMEFYGCRILSVQQDTIYKVTTLSGELTEMAALSDNDAATTVGMATCNNQPVQTFIIPTGNKVSATVDISVHLQLSDICNLANVHVYVLVHRYPPLNEVHVGSFDMCTVGNMANTSGGVWAMPYTCTCIYSKCEYVIVKVLVSHQATVTGECVNIHDITVGP